MRNGHNPQELGRESLQIHAIMVIRVQAKQSHNKMQFEFRIGASIRQMLSLPERMANKFHNTRTDEMIPCSILETFFVLNPRPSTIPLTLPFGTDRSQRPWIQD